MHVHKYMFSSSARLIDTGAAVNDVVPIPMDGGGGAEHPNVLAGDEALQAHVRPQGNGSGQRRRGALGSLRPHQGQHAEKRERR